MSEEKDRPIIEMRIKVGGREVDIRIQQPEEETRTDLDYRWRLRGDDKFSDIGQGTIPGLLFDVGAAAKAKLEKVNLYRPY